MKRLIKYTYYSYTLGCECCSDSHSTYDVYEDDKLVSEDNYIYVICCEQELREELSHLEPFDVHPDTEYF